MQRHTVTSSLLLLALVSIALSIGSKVSAEDIPKLHRLPPVGAATRLSAKDSPRGAWIAPAPQLRLVSADSNLIPITQPTPLDSVELQGENDNVSLVATEASLPRVLQMIADHHGFNFVLGPDVVGPVTVSIRSARLDEVLDAILSVSGYRWHRNGNLLYVTSMANSANLGREVQGRMLRVFPLNFIAATDVEAVATGLLSQGGKAYITEADPIDTKKTRELLVVEDLPEVIESIAEYIAQIDHAPRQVLIEAHVLQVALSEDEKHGINLRNLTRIGGSELLVTTKGFADETVPQGLGIRINGSDLGAVLECIRTQTNSRTLASPKLTVVNNQEAKLQIGQRLSYNVATTTQTTTIQSVQFLEVGIVLTVQPSIADDGQILMSVLPKVSGGKINQTSGLPEEETTEVSTTVLMPDGGGMIIGGLIKDETVNNVANVAGLGRIPGLGMLFRRKSDLTRRNEIIVALVAHVVPDIGCVRPHEHCELQTTLPSYASQSLGQSFMIDSQGSFDETYLESSPVESVTAPE